MVRRKRLLEKVCSEMTVYTSVLDNEDHGNVLLVRLSFPWLIFRCLYIGFRAL